MRYLKKGFIFWCQRWSCLKWYKRYIVRSASYLSVPYYRRSRIMLIFQGQCFRSTCEKRERFKGRKYPCWRKYVYSMCMPLSSSSSFASSSSSTSSSTSSTTVSARPLSSLPSKTTFSYNFSNLLTHWHTPKPCHCGNISLPRYPISIPSCQTLFTLHTHLFIVQMTAPLWLMATYQCCWNTCITIVSTER